MARTTDLLEELIRRLGDDSGPVERVIGEWTGPEVGLAADSVTGSAPRDFALSVVEELGKTWGATGDPTWVNGLVPGHGVEQPTGDESEIDYMFSLYRRPRIYAYARLRGDSRHPPNQMRLILGVMKKPEDHGD
jgi:hypothetical protein